MSSARSFRRRPPRPSEQAADAIHSAAIHLLRSLRREDARLGVGPAGLSALSVLIYGGPKTMGQLAQIEQVRPATMTRIIRALGRGGLVTGVRAERDRRSTIVEVTPTGRSVMRLGHANRVLELERRMERLNESEIALISRAAQLIEQISKHHTLA